MHSGVFEVNLLPAVGSIEANFVGPSSRSGKEKHSRNEIGRYRIEPLPAERKGEGTSPKLLSFDVQCLTLAV